MKNELVEITEAEVLPAGVRSLQELADDIHSRQFEKRDRLLETLDLHIADGRDLLEARQRFPSDNDYGAWFDRQDFGFSLRWAWTLTQAAEHEPQIRELVGSQLPTGSANIEKAVKDVRKRLGLSASRTARETPPPPTGTFSVLYADPPWEYDFSKSPTRDIENKYPTMELDEIKKLDIPTPADDSVLFLWATSPKLPQGLEVVEAWGFDYKTCMVWVKDKIGMGYYARQRHELLLIAGRGALPVPEPADRPDSVILAPRGEHSQKPAEVYGLIESMYPNLPRIELFARIAWPGWESWGYEAPI